MENVSDIIIYSTRNRLSHTIRLMSHGKYANNSTINHLIRNNHCDISFYIRRSSDACKWKRKVRQYIYLNVYHGREENSFLSACLSMIKVLVFFSSKENGSQRKRCRIYDYSNVIGLYSSTDMEYSHHVLDNSFHCFLYWCSNE